MIIKPPIEINELAVFYIMRYEIYFHDARISSDLLDLMIFETLYIWNQIGDNDQDIVPKLDHNISATTSTLLYRPLSYSYINDIDWATKIKDFVATDSSFYKVCDFVFHHFKDFSEEKAEALLDIWWSNMEESQDFG